MSFRFQVCLDKGTERERWHEMSTTGPAAREKQRRRDLASGRPPYRAEPEFPVRRKP